VDSDVFRRQIILKPGDGKAGVAIDEHIAAAIIENILASRSARKQSNATRFSTCSLVSDLLTF
jgi:hypothetical protein